MPTAQRITKAQRAAVCALVLVGIGFVKSCRIAGVPDRSLRALLPKDWWGRHGSSPTKFRGDALLAIKSAYLDRSIRLADIATAYGINHRHVTLLAHRHNWPRRPRGKGAQLPIALTKITPETRNRYRKLQRIIGRSAAEQAVFGKAA